MNRLFVFSLMTTLGLGSMALAQPSGAAGSGADAQGHRGHHGAKRFEKLDKNGDGAVSLDELKTNMRERFTAADANKDGKTTKSELKAHFDAKRAEWAKKRGDKKGRHHGPRGHKGEHFFGKLDQNGNDAIEKSEIDAAAQERFAKLDANGDGKLTADEMKHGRHGRCGKHGKHGKHGAEKS